MAKGVGDHVVIAAIAERELSDLAMVDGGDPGQAKTSRNKLINFFKKHLRRSENGKVNSELDKAPLPIDVIREIRRS